VEIKQSGEGLYGFD